MNSDVNECLVPGTCSQTCLNTVGSYKCSCYKGYMLQRDGSSCRALSDDRPKLLLANPRKIRQIDLLSKQTTPLLNDLNSAVAFDYLYKNKTIIWSDVSAEKIMMCACIF